MNIGDYVYLYLFDFKKSINNMNRLRNDRFGCITNKTILSNNNGNDVILYSIRLLCNDNVIIYRTDNLSTNMVSIEQLKELINDSNISDAKKQMLNNQIDCIINM
jgi:hypothetical protein